MYFVRCVNFNWNVILFEPLQEKSQPFVKLSICCNKHFVNLKSNSALLYNKGHNLLTSAFPKNMLS